ncbi:MAG: hypothetical protein AB1925_24120 [Actinomycetota bacterium]
MTAATISLSREDGFPRFFCCRCGSKVFDEEGVAEEFCEHVCVLFDEMGDPLMGPAASEDLLGRLEDADEADFGELAKLFESNAVLFQLREEARGGGHDGWTCFVALTLD